MIETENTDKVISLLKKYTNKEIIIKDIKEFANDPVFSSAVSYLGTCAEYEHSIVVHLNFDHNPDIVEAVFVHEILHKISRHEGFPGVIINENIAKALPPNMYQVLPKLQSFFSSTIDHPLVFSRMASNFKLNLEAYFEIQVSQKIKRLSKTHPFGTLEYYFFVQQDILDGLDYFLYPEIERDKLLCIFKEKSPMAYDSCFSLHGKLKRIGFDTPELSYKFADLIKSHIIKYGDGKSVGIYNLMWRALEIVTGNELHSLFDKGIV